MVNEAEGRVKLTNLEWAEILEQMVCVYPGDPDGSLMREACELRGIPYEPPELTITFEPETDLGREALRHAE